MFWAGQLYNIVLLYASKGLEGSMGWYMYAVVGAKVVLTLAGLCAILPLRFTRAVPVGCATVFALFDLYFNGVAFHRANGSLSALRIADVPRLWQANIFSPPLILLWMAYLAATAALVYFASVARREA